MLMNQLDQVRMLLNSLIENPQQITLTVCTIRLTPKVKLADLLNILDHMAKQGGVLWSISKPKIALSEKHVFYTFYHTLKAFLLNKNISNKFNIEFLLRLTCKDQISDALRLAGCSDPVDTFCLYLASNSASLLKSFLSNLTSHLKQLVTMLEVSEGQDCYSNFLLNELKVPENEFSLTQYHLSALNSQLKSILTRMALLSLKKK